MIAINGWKNDGEKTEQRGFAQLVHGYFGMFRSPTTYMARIHWAMGKEDAEDLLSAASMIHRRLDSAHTPARV